MDRKEELSSVDLAALVGELGAYEGAKLDKAYLYGDDFLRLRMRHFERGRVELLIEVGEIKRAHVSDPQRVADAPGRPPNFAKMLRNRLTGGDFVGVTQYGFDRILEFQFERGDEETTIIAELFGEGNIAVVDSTGEVIDSLDTVRLRSRTVAPGAQYEYPDTRVNPLEISAEGLAARMRDSDTDVVRTLATQINLGGLYAEEICTRAGVEKGKPIEEATDDEFDALHAELQRLREQVASADLEPRLYEEEGTVVDVAPFPLAEYEDVDARAFDTFTEAVDVYFHRLERDDDDDGSDPAETDRPDFEAEIAKQERIIEQQENAIEEFQTQAEQEREKAEALYANYDLADELLTTVGEAREAGHDWDEIADRLAEGAEQGIPAAEAVAGVDADGGTVTITLDGTDVDLDPTMGVEKNANRLYTEAKRIEEKKEGARAAIENTREDLEAVKRRREEWEQTDDDGGDDDDGEDRDIDWLSRSSVPIRKSEQWYERFRWFRTTDDFLVIGGRNADENEELVKKYLDPSDLFLHAQAHGGPATILKATAPNEPARDVEIPESSREQAAKFAVSYASVWKDGRFEGDAYLVESDQVSKTAESGEYLEKGGFAIRGDRTYYRDVSVGVAIGITCEPDTRVIGGPPEAIRPRTETSVTVEPGQFAQNDAAKRIYRTFRERFADTSFVRKIASPDLIQEFLPPGGSRIVDSDGGA